jgi:hypothetical protein
VPIAAVPLQAQDEAEMTRDTARFPVRFKAETIGDE